VPQSPGRRIHLPIEFANLALERQRPESFRLAPTGDMTVDDFAGARDESAGQILLGKIPGLITVSTT
jgi:hypothetical protein